MRIAAKIDRNQPEIVKALRSIGCSVQTLAAVGKGAPDLLVARNGSLWLMEVKDGSKPPSGRKLTPDQIEWHLNWGSKVHVVNNIDEAVSIVTAV